MSEMKMSRIAVLDGDKQQGLVPRNDNEMFLQKKQGSESL